MAIVYMLDLSFPRMGKWKAVQSRIEDLLGNCQDTGAGFGQRDLTYSYTSEEQRDQAVTDLAAENIRNLMVNTWSYNDDDEVL